MVSTSSFAVCGKSRTIVIPTGSWSFMIAYTRAFEFRYTYPRAIIPIAGATYQYPLNKSFNFSIWYVSMPYMRANKSLFISQSEHSSAQTLWFIITLKLIIGFQGKILLEKSNPFIFCLIHTAEDTISCIAVR